MNKEGVLVIGSANMDLVVQTKRFPKPGETILGKNLEMFPGGKGANQAVSCAKLGAKTFFIGKMGQDQFCDKLCHQMKNDGVNIDNLLIDKNESTGTAFIIVDNEGQNEIIVISGSNMKLSPDDISINKNLFSEVKVVLTQLEIPIKTVLSAAEYSKENNLIFILNPAPAFILPLELFPMIDFLTPNETELEMLSGIYISDLKTAELAAKKVLKKGVKNIIITMGKKGALLVNKDKVELFPAQKVETIDSTAAGDAFNGALAFSLCNDAEISDAIRFANQAAAISVTRKGAQSSMPSFEELKEIISV